MDGFSSEDRWDHVKAEHKGIGRLILSSRFLLLTAILWITIAEVITVYASPGVGVWLHAFLLTIVLVFGLYEKSRPIARAWFFLAFAPLIRVISLSMPLSGFAFILAAPRYSLLASIFPKPRAMDLTSQLGLSMGVSIALTTIIGLILNYTVVGINSTTVLIAETIFVVVCSAVALWRRMTIDEENSGEAYSEAYFLNRKLPWALALYIVFMVIFSVGSPVTNQAHTAVVSDAQEYFTEFYIIEHDPQEDASQDVYLTGRADALYRDSNKPGGCGYRLPSRGVGG